MAKRKKKEELVLDSTMQEISDGMAKGFTEEQTRRITIEQVRRWMNIMTLQHGKTDCACCKSHIQSYKRSISSSQVYWMFALYKLSKGTTKYVDFKRVGYYLFEKLGRNASDYTTLTYWDLIEVDPDALGFYRLTPKGKDFIEGKIKVPKDIYLTNGKMWKKSVEEISYVDCKKFDVTEITKLN